MSRPGLLDSRCTRRLLWAHKKHRPNTGSVKSYLRHFACNGVSMFCPHCWPSNLSWIQLKFVKARGGFLSARLPDVSDTDFDHAVGHTTPSLHPSSSLSPPWLASLYLCLFNVPERRRRCQRGLVKLSCRERKMIGARGEPLQHWEKVMFYGTFF